MSESASLLSVDDALERILQLADALPFERANIDEAVGRATSADIAAARTVPPWDNSAMDGFAVRSEDVAAAPVRLRIVETIFAGQFPTRAIGAGECSRIMTGGPLPDGADAVVMQERTRRSPSSADVEVLEAVAAGTSVRRRGEDARQGELLLTRGTPIGIAEAALLWAQGITQVEVPRRPRVAILATGDELCPVGEPADEKIIDSNSPALALATRRAGAIPSSLGIARDTLEDVTRKLTRAQDHDVVLTSAGVSVGEHDFVKDALDGLGVEMNFWRVAIKPGKPLAVGHKGRTLFFGLPGNPTSSLVSFELFVRPALRRMLGHSVVRPPRVRGRCEVDLRKAAGLSHFIRVTAEWRDGELWARPLSSQTSGALRSAVGATHLMLFPEPSTSLRAGDPVELLPVSWAP